MTPKLKNIDLKARLADKDEYEKRLRKAQLQLLLIQRHLYENKREAVFVFEGWDAAGKGGSDLRDHGLASHGRSEIGLAERHDALADAVVARSE